MFARRQPTTRPYPWEALPKCSLAAEEMARRTRRVLHQSLDMTRLAGAVRELLAAEIEAFGVEEPDVGSGGFESFGADVQLEHPAFSIALSVESGLASLLLTRLLSRPARFVQQSPLSPELRGAWHAICEETARRLVVGQPLRLAEGSPVPGGQRVPFWIRVEGQTYRGNAVTHVHDSVVPPRSFHSEAQKLPVKLPLVFASVSLAGAELAQLSPGDLFLPAQWSAEPGGSGAVFACAPALESALQFESSGGELKLLGGATLKFDEESEMVEENDTAEDAVVDAPVVVRVEVGAVTMSAREWMELAPGDVVSTGNPLAAPVVLRAAGRKIAVGELVNLEGEMGVRVTKLG